MKKQSKKKVFRKISVKGIAKNNKAITLIALVITIIVLLILAGVSIATLTGDNGLLIKAQQAKEENEKAADRDLIAIAVSEAQIGENGYQELNETNFKQALENQFKGRQLEVIDNGDGSFVINLDNNSKIYYADSDGEIISNENMLAISTVDELKAFRDDVNSGNTYEGKYVYLTDNITLNINEEWEPIGIYQQDSTNPDDETNKPFRGIFDGNGYEVDGIYINTTDKAQGLFGLVIGGKILNVGIGENCNITGEIATGTIAGYLYNNSYANNCYNKSDLTVGSYSGGVFGQVNLQSKIKNCYNLGNVNTSASKNTIGGIAGQLIENSQMYNCYNDGNINTNNVTVNTIGGIAGRINQGIVEECFNIGQVNGDLYVGGIIGSVQGTDNGKVEKCYNTGNIEGRSSVGGIIGGMIGINQKEINNCYNTGNISGEDITGGIVGNNLGKLNNSYNIGIISSNTTKVGGIAGQNDGGTIKNTYSLEGKCENIIGENVNNATIETSSIKTEQKMKLLSSTLGSAFKEDTNNKNNGYPILQWQCDPTMGN